ncbi:hypothetical protein [Brachyspira hyodysenteriae]|uniref:hypothetical protein n=1 Tax=Brachyspira hyodysenteriae TaxID=159 RepID=UPI001183F3C4|nr:hypothetical protein [Brachyspira hyodysenteriae]TVL66051.1 hypothetical protein A9X85_06580 [Brachyspira hyodysenteriae]TVL74491.1 hypothetical protein A9X79_02140 [Brachyspira hyodysenteriae]
MEKNIGYLGAFNINSTNYLIPASYIVFENINISLMDYDIIVFNPSSFYNKNIYYNNDLNEDTNLIITIFNKWVEKINLFIKNNNSIFIFLPIYYGNKIINDINNYYITKSLLIFEKLEYESGCIVNKTKYSILDNLYNRFKNNFIYNATYTGVKFRNLENKTYNIFCGKYKDKILASIIEIENGGRIFILPQIIFQDSKDIEDLQKIILEIDKKSRYNKEKTSVPEWANNEIYLTEKSKNIISKINDNNEQIDELKNNNIVLNEELEKEEAIKDLLFENGKPLENIIIEALNILDYKAENVIINDTEIDILATSPENDIFCCEVEGKDNSAIDVTKFRQLSDNLNVYEDEYPDSNPIGILFGNAFRLKPLEERGEEHFTKHCIERAKKRNIILIKTSDLFFVIKTIKNCDNEDIRNNYKKKCREAILNSVGNIVSFPNINK